MFNREIRDEVLQEGAIVTTGVLHRMIYIKKIDEEK